MNTISHHIFPSASPNHSPIRFGNTPHRTSQEKPVKTLQTGTSKLAFQDEVNLFQEALKPPATPHASSKLAAPFKGIANWFRDFILGSLELITTLVKRR